MNALAGAQEAEPLTNILNIDLRKNSRRIRLKANCNP
jgi:hypothetical protein